MSRLLWKVKSKKNIVNRVRKLNVIIVCVDEFRGDCLAANGRNPDIRTPNLDEFSRQGVNFSNHYTCFPKCVPARVAMMTGRYCHTDGYRTITQFMPKGTPDIASSLQASGYQLVELGLNHCWENMFAATHRPPELKPGEAGMAFDYHAWTPPFAANWNRWKSKMAATDRSSGQPATLADGRGFVQRIHHHWSDDVMAENAVHFLTSVRDRSRPFFLQVNLGATHPPYHVEDPWFSMYDPRRITPFPFQLPANPSEPLLRQREVRTGFDIPESTLRRIQSTYYGLASRADHHVGRILSCIREQGLFDNSIVIFLSDHGDFAGQYGLVEKWDTVFSDCLTNVPTILRAPDLPTGTTVTSLTEHTDLAPTLCELLGLPPLFGMHGTSMLPAISGRTTRDAVFADGGHEDEMLGRFSFYDDGKPRPPTDVGLPSLGDGKQETYRRFPDTMARAKMIRTQRYKMVVRLRGGNELYDLAADPWELNNRWADPSLDRVKLQLQQRLIEWCLATDTDRPHQRVVGA